MGLLDRFRSDEDQSQKVAFIGIDGVPKSLLKDLIEDGRLPNIERISGGGIDSMNAVVPPESSACWPAMTTGTNPGKTGVLGFQERERGSYDTYIPLGKHVKSKRVWDVVGDSGRRSVVSNVPVTFPPEEIDGTMVSGFLTPEIESVSNDPEVIEYLKSIDYRVDVDASLGHDDKEEFIRNARETLDARAEALYHFIENEDWSLLWHVFMATDRVNHFLWENYEEGDQLGDEFVEFYERVDEVIGEIRERLDDDTSMIVAADHGFCRLEHEIDMNAWLRDEGWQSVDVEAEEGDCEVETSLENITDDTKAYSLIPGRFYINLEGREPRGSVSEDDYDEVRDQLVGMLEDLEDPDGNEVIDEVYVREEVYDGDEFGITPDVVCVPNRGYDLKASFGPDKPVYKKGERNGMHTFDDATLIVDTDDEVEIDADDASITDVAPTVLDLMDIDAPDEIDGESLVE
ncbi:MAG: alkaline phosphatase family protein [Halobacteria archaeon]|nr:alkaline phosphatase family protein [Halobacteria archaeon]